jgi:hypothetical protein
MNDTQFGRRLRRRATITIEIVPVADIDDRIVLRGRVDWRGELLQAEENSGAQALYPCLLHGGHG